MGPRFRGDDMPNKKAGVAAGFLVVIQSAISCLRVI
jgi:hypothetical protein